MRALSPLVLGLALAGALLLLVGDYLYLRDNFDNSPSYRMNTVFKLHRFAWLLLGLASSALLERIATGGREDPGTPVAESPGRVVGFRRWAG